MTTPTREQVVQWARDAQGSFSDGLVLQAWIPFMTRLTELARADLAATVAEQAKEIDQSAIQFLDLSAQICSLKKDVQRLQMALADTEALETGTAERLATSQANAAQLLEFIDKWCRFDSLNMDLAEWQLAGRWYKESKPDETALREHDANLVDRIAEQVDLFYPKQSLQEIADNIRNGEWS